MLDITIKRKKRSKKVKQLEEECKKGLTGEVTTENLDKIINILAEIEQLTEDIHKGIEELKEC